jgi:molecular chaperone DnaK
MKISKGIGIDLGTTNSSVAVMDLTDSRIIMYTDRMGVSTTPSCVWLNPKTGEIVVGKKAFRRRGAHPEPITSIKRWMGTSQTVRLGERDMLPEEVSAEILKELRRQIEGTMRSEMAQEGLDFVVDRAIITIPAYFQLPAIEATRKAGELAGLEIIELLHEPTAAAVHYSWKHNLVEDATFLVFDPGGGTFDVAVLRRVAGEPEVLGVAGDTFLGGDDLDRRLAELIRRRLVEDDYELELDVENDPEDALRITRLVLLAEGVKKRLTDQGESLLRDSNTLTDKDGDRVFIEMMIVRSEFEEEIQDLVARMIPKCWEALAKAHQKAGITLGDIDYVLLVGGTSYVPLVQQTARLHFCDCENAHQYTPEETEAILNGIVPEHRDTARRLIEMGERARCPEPVFEDPDTCNARGAAIRAALAGLAIYNDEETVRVIFRGQGATSGTKATIAGKVEVSDNGEWIALSSGRVVAELAEAGLQDQEFLDQRGGFRFRGLPLQAGTVNQFNFEVHDEDGRLLATVGRPIAQDEGAVDLGSGVLTTAVLPTPIRIEGLVKGRRGKRDIVPETTMLPAEAHFTFRLATNPGYIVIPIYQGRRLIKEIHADIDPSLPPGEPIEFDISVDEQAFIVCRFRIGADEFAAAIEPPKMEVPTRQAVDDKVKELNEALAYRSPGDQVVFRAKMMALKRDIVEARESGEEPKIIERYEELCNLVEEARDVHAALEPPKEEFDELVQKCRLLARKLAQANPNRDLQEMEKDILTHQQEGERAARSMDQQAYSEAFEMLVMYGQGLQKELESQRDGPSKQPPVDPAVQASQYVEHLRGACRELLGFAEACGRELAERIEKSRDTRQVEQFQRQQTTARQARDRLVAIDRSLAELQPGISTDPQRVLRECQVIEVDLKRIYQQLQSIHGGGVAELPPLPDLG